MLKGVSLRSYMRVYGRGITLWALMFCFGYVYIFMFSEIRVLKVLGGWPEEKYLRKRVEDSRDTFT